MNTRGILIAATLAVLSVSCGTGAEVDTTAAQAPQVDAVEQAEIDSPAGDVASVNPLETCSESPRDTSGLAGVFFESVPLIWTEIDHQELIDSANDGNFDLKEREFLDAGDLDAGNVELSSAYDSLEALNSLTYPTYLAGIWTDEITKEPFRLGILVGVTDDGQISFLGDCQQTLTAAFQIWFTETSLDTTTMTEVDALRILVIDARLQRELLGEQAPTIQQWESNPPELRSLDTAALPPSVFEDLQPILLKVTLPTWWGGQASSEILCPFTPEVGWGEICIGPSVDPKEGNLILESWISSTGTTELRLVDETDYTRSHLLGTIDGLWQNDKLVNIEFADTSSIEDLKSTADGIVVSFGEGGLQTQPGLANDTLLVEEPADFTKSDPSR